MVYRNTVAIIGASSEVGTAVARSISASFRLLLMDKEGTALSGLQAQLESANGNAEVDVLHCCKNASWEADIIVVADGGEDLEELALKMKEVSNCKAVLHFTPHHHDKDRLQQLLPHAKVVTVISDPSLTDAFIHGSDKEALDTAKKLVTAMACGS